MHSSREFSFHLQEGAYSSGFDEPRSKLSVIDAKCHNKPIEQRRDPTNPRKEALATRGSVEMRDNRVRYRVHATHVSCFLLFPLDIWDAS